MCQPCTHREWSISLRRSTASAWSLSEGLVTASITAAQIEDYLAQLSAVLEMVTLLQPLTHKSETCGWAGWIHWGTSGAHFYAWDQPRLFFSVDIYTCKPFSVERAVAFTRVFFQATTVVHREF